MERLKLEMNCGEHGNFAGCNWDLATYRWKFDKIRKTNQYDEHQGRLALQLMASIQLWRSMTPLICFHIMEWYQPNRVMQKFGMVQPISQKPL
ncbi:hypothetical protein VNO78_12467 [Psophocarpus tetragonolobus]|uniref:Aminotransferase-like plant mobile domain-containing protein n=1 Tax=Psophocarpus tetragonolobus TaxID=3891 RepID=A0AAN9SP65_PSOTE